MDKNQWKDKFQEILNVCQSELKRTTEIGKKMLSASKANSDLHEAYEDLGRLVEQCMNSKSLEWNNSEANEILSKIRDYKIHLEEIEGEVKEIKKTSNFSTEEENH